MRQRLLHLVEPFMGGKEPPVACARRCAGGMAVEAFFRGLSKLGSMHPNANPARHGVEKLVDIPYRDTGERAHLLDVYRQETVPGSLRPVVLYIHGGGFRILSKDTHWLMGLAFARLGYVVFNINYRLAPEHPFPAAIEDTCDAYAWVLENAERFGGDPSRIVVSGESAGGNLSTALTVAACFERPEPYARMVYDTGVVPVASIPACALLQVSNWQRLAEHQPMSTWLRDRLGEISEGYLPPGANGHPGGTLMADPLLLLESDQEPQRPLPPFFASVGTRDPLLDDTRRLGAALERRGVPNLVEYYQGEVHAFQALVFRRKARLYWKHTERFLRSNAEDATRSPTRG